MRRSWCSVMRSRCFGVRPPGPGRTELTGRFLRRWPGWCRLCCAPICSYRWARCWPGTTHVHGELCRLGHRISESMVRRIPAISPGPVLPRQPQYQVADLWAGPRPTRPARIRPLARDQSAVKGSPNRLLDLLVTGLVVGAGTKPLHDLISQIQTTSAKSMASASATTTG